MQDEAAALRERLNITTVATQHGTPGKTGPAKQVLPDEHFLQKQNVREGFMDCSDRARQRNANRKMTSLRALSVNDGRSVAYSRSARAKLDPALILRIRCVCARHCAATSRGLARHDVVKLPLAWHRLRSQCGVYTSICAPGAVVDKGRGLLAGS